MGCTIRQIVDTVTDEQDVRELLAVIAERMRAEGMTFAAIDRVLFGGTKYGDLSRQLVKA